MRNIYFSVICKFLFANHNNCAIIIKHGRNMLSWSSGQDVALSRRNQGFDSPREYQYKKEISENGISFLLLFRSSEVFKQALPAIKQFLHFPACTGEGMLWCSCICGYFNASPFVIYYM